MKKIKWILIVILLVCLATLIFNYFRGTFSQTTELVPDKHYNVLNFGADGGDLEADTVAFQEALDKAKEELILNSGKIIQVNVPAGTYYIDRALYIYSNTILHLDSDAIIMKNGNRGAFLMASFIDIFGKRCTLQDDNLVNGCNKGKYNQWKNIKIEGGTFDFNNINATNYFRHGENLIIKDTKFINMASYHAFNLSATKDILVTGVVFRDQNYLESANRPLFTNEVIHLDTAEVSGEATTYPVDGTPVMNVIIENSQFINVYTGIGAHGFYADEALLGNNIVIRNNTFTNISYFAINMAAHRNISIYGNTAVGAENSYAFLATGYTHGNVHDNTISGFSNSITLSANNNYNLTYDDDMDENKTYNYYNVTYNSDGGTGEMADGVFLFGEKSKLSKNQFTRDGYKFVGWKNHRVVYDMWCASYQVDGVTKRAYMTLSDMANYNADYCIFADEALVTNLLPSYGQTAELVAIWKHINKITILSMPRKTEYVMNKDNLNLSGGVIRVTYDDNTHEDIEMTALEHSELDNTSIGKKQIQVTYLGVSTTFDVKVVSDTKSLSFGKKTLEIDKTNNILYRINPKDNYASLSQGFKNNTNITLNDNVASNTVIKTGDKIHVTLDGTETILTVSVLGDVTGDGKIELNDIGKLYRYYQKKLTMNAEAIYAGDINGDGEIEINDVGKLYRYYHGSIDDLEAIDE